MNWAAWGPTIVSVVAMIFTAGLMLGKLRGHDSTLGEHRTWLLGHDADLRDHGERLARSEAWRDGYAAAKSDKAAKV
jgi:hypothetical protein